MYGKCQGSYNTFASRWGILELRPSYSLPLHHLCFTGASTVTVSGAGSGAGASVDSGADAVSVPALDHAIVLSGMAKLSDADRKIVTTGGTFFSSLIKVSPPC